MMRLLMMAAMCLAACLDIAVAVDPRYPDWPCRQLKVPSINATLVWPEMAQDPPPKDEAPSAELLSLVARLAQRRTPLKEAEKLINGYVSGSAEEKKAKARTLFFALLDELNTERGHVMDGIERAYRKQKGMAEKIKADTLKMRELQDAAADEGKIRPLSEELLWETRVFEDRRVTMTYACDVPRHIEQRLYDLTKLIQQAAQGS